MSQAEVVRREAARRRLSRFTQYTFPGYRKNFHHRLICEALEAVARYELPRLIIVAPPRHGKSELVSRRFPAWYLGNNPHRQVISATYGQDLSDRMSKDVQGIIESDLYADLYPALEFGDKKKINEFNLAKHLGGGTYKATSVGGSVTGFGANILLVDDPIKNREEAESQKIRDAAWDSFTDDFMSRLEAPNAVVVMATRWHEDDLIGRILASPTANEWVILHLPRVQDEDPTIVDLRAHGAPLWPERLMLPWERCPELADWPANSAEVMAAYEAGYVLNEDDEMAVGDVVRRDEAAHAARPFDPADYSGADAFFEDAQTIREEDKKVVSALSLVARDLAHYNSYQKNSPYGASALEQGRPTPKGGTLVDPDAVNTYLGTPADRAMFSENLVISVDANFKKTKTSDFAAATVFGRTSKPNALYVIDEFHGRVNYPQLKRAVIRLARQYPRAAILVEAKANGQALIDDLRDEGFSRVIPFEPDKHGSKESRAQLAAEYVAGGGLFVPTPQQAPFIVAWLEEVVKYGTAKYDDRMDTLSQAVIHYAGSRTGLSHLRRIVGVTG